MADRKFYTLKEKLRILRRYVELGSLAETERRENVPDTTLRRWIREHRAEIEMFEDEMEQEIARQLKVGIRQGMQNYAKQQRRIAELQEESVSTDNNGHMIDFASEMMSKSSSYMDSQIKNYRLTHGETTENVGVTLEEILKACQGEEF